MALATMQAVFSAAIAVMIIPPFLPVLAQYDGIILTQDNLHTLLAFKLALEDPHGALASWSEGSAPQACSGSWVGIKCSQGKVIVLQLPGKGLGGMISDQVGQLTQLRKLNLHTNKIRGAIPSSLAGLSNLRGLFLYRNQFSGSIPPGIGNSPLLQAIDLSKNQLVGSAPAEIAASSKLLLLDLSFNNISGALPADWAANPSLILLNVSHNHLTGVLPDAWGGNGSTHHLKYFIASNNNLSGSLPPSLSSLKALQTLDLSFNRFSGFISNALTQLEDLTSLNVSYNFFSGSIPAFKHSFKESSFKGNAGLCGLNTVAPCHSSPPPASPKSSPDHLLPESEQQQGHRINTLVLILIILGCAFIFSSAIVLLLFILWQTRAGHQAEAEKGSGYAVAEKAKVEAAAGKLVLFEGSFTAEDLLSATAEVMGKSSYGNVYKASLENGSSVVVKRLREGIVRSQKEFEVEVNLLGKFQHPNLVTLSAYYWGPMNEKLLIFEFMPGGSLTVNLHAREPETPLGWIERMTIAAGVARGLNYLHGQERIHGNLSSSKIFLDCNLTAKISDFGLTRLMTKTANSSIFATANTLDYRAPELKKLKKATTKSDVYSFGIVLLELLTGKPPGKPVVHDTATLNMPQWVSSVMKEEWSSEVFDVELMKGSVPSGDKMLQMLQLALSCISSTPNLRPEMVEVLHQLEEIAAEFPDPSFFGPG